MHYDIEETSISKLFSIDIDSSRCRRNIDIEVQNFDIGIYRYRTFSRYRSTLFRYPCTMSKLCASTSNVVFFDICAFLPGLLLPVLGSGHILPCKLFIAHQTFGLRPKPLESPHDFVTEAEVSKARIGEALAVRLPEASPDASSESSPADPATAGGVVGVAAAGDP